MILNMVTQEADMPVGLLCDYDTGMFSHEDLGEPNFTDVYHLLNAVCYHEAGHAVVGYAFGYSIKDVSIIANRCLSNGQPALAMKA